MHTMLHCPHMPLFLRRLQNSKSLIAPSLKAVTHSFLGRDIQRCIETKLQPSLNNPFFTAIKNCLALGLFAATWDKPPCKMYAICAMHADMALFQTTTLCPSFKLLGAELFFFGSSVDPMYSHGPYCSDMPVCRRR